MKIAQLTLPLHSNYGGILQAYALQKVLRDMGHSVVLLNRQVPMSVKGWSERIGLRTLSILKSAWRKYALREKGVEIHNPFHLEDFSSKRSRFRVGPRQFCYKNMIISRPLFTEEALFRYVKKQGFDAIIVGSDQVWRQGYVFRITDFFLAFLPKEYKIKRIAYATSIGGDKLDIDKALLPACKAGLDKFNAISVREESARGFLASIFKTDSEVTLDPTLLLTKADWQQLIVEPDDKMEEALVYYLLDKNEEDEELLRDVASTLRLKTKRLDTEVYTDKDEPRGIDFISNWLASLFNAQFVVTDSFHGCVFSILFNKPFIAIANRERGVDRFESLLKRFQLFDRLVFTFEDYLARRHEILAPINYTQVNDLLNVSRSDSLRFLQESLESR